ncbi:MAG: type II secretion system F family protein [Acidimicrobiia bacterium]
MATTFQYEAFTREGEPNNGQLTAQDLEDARTQLAQQRLLVVSVKERKQLSLAQKDLRLRPNNVSLKDQAWMARNLATSQAAGLSMFRSMGMLAKQRAKDPIGKVLAEMHQEVADGKPLAGAFRTQEAKLGPLTCALIEAGEASGQLDNALGRLADITEARVRLKRKIVSAMMYPVMVLLLTLGITVVMLMTIVPTFAGMYKGFGNAKLPLPTQMLMNLSGMLTGLWYLWIPAVITLIVAAVAFKRSEQGKRMIDRTVIRLPIFGKLIRQTIVARTAAVMASLTNAGVNLLEVLDLTATVAGNAVYADALHAARDKVREGRSLSRAIADTEVFPEVFCQLIGVGEETGAMADLIGRYAKATEDEVQTMVDGLSSLIEPILIIVLGGIVGGLIIALYLPLFDVITKVQ